MSKAIKLFVYLIFFILALNTKLVYADEAQKILVYHKEAVNQDAQLEAMVADNNWIEWTVQTSTITTDDLEDKTHIILYSQRHDLKYTNEELDTLQQWFNIGGKTIWITSDSDFFTNNGRISSANQILITINSCLRTESASVRDPVNNAEPPYRMLALPNTEDAEITTIIEGVDTVLVSGPSPVIAYINGDYLTLEDTVHTDIHLILMSQSTSELVDNTPPNPEAHIITTGKYCVMAIEHIPEKHNTIIVSGESPFAIGEGMYKPEILYPKKYTETYPQQGALLVTNLLHYTVDKHWVETQKETKEIPLPTTSIILAILVSLKIFHLLNKKQSN